MRHEDFKKAIDSIQVPKEKLENLMINEKQHMFSIKRIVVVCTLLLALGLGLLPNKTNEIYNYTIHVSAYGQSDTLKDEPIELTIPQAILKDGFGYSNGYDEKQGYVLIGKIPFELFFEGENIKEIHYQMFSNKQSSMTLFTELTQTQMQSPFKEDEYIVHKHYGEYSEEAKQLAYEYFKIIETDTSDELFKKLYSSDKKENPEVAPLFWLRKNSLKETKLTYDDQFNHKTKIELWMESKLTQEESQRDNFNDMLNKTIDVLENTKIQVNIIYNNGEKKIKTISFKKGIDNHEYCLVEIK